MAEPPPRKPRPARPAAATLLRAAGRTLAEFLPLAPAETELLHATREGRQAQIADVCPTEETDANRVRAGFVRFLALGGDADAPVHEHGVQLSGAWIAGSLDFVAARAVCPLELHKCRIAQIDAIAASLMHLSLAGSRLDGDCDGDRLQCGGSIMLDDGFHAHGEVRLIGATIGGNLECTSGRFESATGEALSCDGARIAGDVALDNEFHATGTVRLTGASIGGQLDCQHGRIDAAGSMALVCDNASISNNVFLGKGFAGQGAVRLNGARIGGSLDCRGGRFESPGDYAFSAEAATIGQAFVFESVAVTGDINIGNMTAALLVDDPASWHGAATLVLDGFSYTKFAGVAPTTAVARIAWLDRQSAADLGADFKAQPWEQLIAVLRAMGHDEDARAVAIAKQQRLRAAGRIAPSLRALHWIWEVLAGYGYRPLRLSLWMVAVWLACGIAFDVGATRGAFGPNSPVIQTDAAIQAACAAGPAGAAANWTTCAAMPDEYTTFTPLAYSADLILPLVDLQQETDWAPVVGLSGVTYWPGVTMRWLMWFEILFGWMASLLLVASLTNLIKKD